MKARRFREAPPLWSSALPRYRPASREERSSGSNSIRWTGRAVELEVGGLVREWRPGQASQEKYSRAASWW